MNINGNVFASVNRNQHCVHIYSVDASGKRTADAVVVGTMGSAGSSHAQLCIPTFACFVHRHGIDTLLISDWGNDRVVEVTASGVFRRAIALKKGRPPYGIAYCGIGDVIAVSLFCAHAVVLLQYESGAVNVGDTIGSGTLGSEDGQLCFPRGVSFTADGRNVLVADGDNHRVSKFSVAGGAFIAHVATTAENGTWFPRDVLQCEDGSIVVTQGKYDGDMSVQCVREDGGQLQSIIIPNAFSLAYSPALKGVAVKTLDGSVFLLRDAWMDGSRNAWLSALSCS